MTSLTQRTRAAACDINGKSTDIVIIEYHSSYLILITQLQTIGAVIHARNKDTITALGPRTPPMNEIHALIATSLERTLNKPITLSIALTPESCNNINTNTMINMARQIVSKVVALHSK